MKQEHLIDGRLRIGQRIAELRKERRLTQEQLADMAGLKQPILQRIEAGRYSTGIDVLYAIAKALGCRIDLILIKK